jgi:gamma-glutamyl phosphate reductase
MKREKNMQHLMTMTVKDKLTLVQELKAMIKIDRANAKAAKVEAKLVKQDMRDKKRAEKIAALEKRLYELKNPVGYKAIRAAKRPSKAIVTKFA